MVQRFNVTPAGLLGRGGESEVYALDAGRVLRIYKAGAPEDYIARRTEFYAALQARQPPFELPDVLESGVIEGRRYTIERRMRGSDFAAVLPSLSGADRERALTSYLRTAGLIGTLTFPEQPFGELLAPGEPLQHVSWPAFLWERMQQTFSRSRTHLVRDVPRIDAVVQHVRAELAALEGIAQRSLVHGDYFPGNCYIDAALDVYGVGDFGYTTVVGDARMDLAGAVAYLEVVDGYRPEDTPFLMRLLAEWYGGDIARWIDLYRLYYSFYFSDCIATDPRTYAWCVHNLSVAA
jgi:putative membrane protein